MWIVMSCPADTILAAPRWHYIPSRATERDWQKGVVGGEFLCEILWAESERKVTLCSCWVDRFVDVPLVEVVRVTAANQPNVPWWAVVAHDVVTPVAATVLVSTTDLGCLTPHELREVTGVLGETRLAVVVVLDFVEPCSDAAGLLEVEATC